MLPTYDEYMNVITVGKKCKHAQSYLTKPCESVNVHINATDHIVANMNCSVYYVKKKFVRLVTQKKTLASLMYVVSSHIQKKPHKRKCNEILLQSLPPRIKKIFLTYTKHMIKTKKPHQTSTQEKKGILVVSQRAFTVLVNRLVCVCVCIGVCVHHAV